MVVALLVPPIPLAFATTCDAGGPYGSTQCIVYLTSGTSWTVPADWHAPDSIIECVGPGCTSGTAVTYYEVTSGLVI